MKLREPEPSNCERKWRKAWCRPRPGAYWSNERECFISRLDPQPPPDDPRWGGRTGGSLYKCSPAFDGFVPGFSHASTFFWADAVPAADPGVLARQAMESMNLVPVTIGMAPPPGSTLLVNVPTWLWAGGPANSWGPVTASAAAGSTSVTATAQVNRVVWDMGDGARVTCGRGNPYAPGASPECSHTYRTPGNRTINAISEWVVRWRANTGETGTIEFDTAASANVTVAEARAVIVGRD